MRTKLRPDLMSTLQRRVTRADNRFAEAGRTIPGALLRPTEDPA